MAAVVRRSEADVLKAGIRGKEEGNLKDFAKEGAAGSRERGEKIFSILSLLFSLLLLSVISLGSVPLALV